jgi:hypothetical protein
MQLKRSEPAATVRVASASRAGALLSTSTAGATLVTARFATAHHVAQHEGNCHHCDESPAMRDALLGLLGRDLGVAPDSPHCAESPIAVHAIAVKLIL